MTLFKASIFLNFHVILIGLYNYFLQVYDNYKVLEIKFMKGEKFWGKKSNQMF